MTACFSVKAETAELKARLERLEEMGRNRPYQTAAAQPIQ